MYINGKRLWFLDVLASLPQLRKILRAPYISWEKTLCACVCVCVCVCLREGEKKGTKGWQSLTSTNNFYCFKNKRSVCFCNKNIQNTHFCFIFIFLEKNMPTLIFLSSLKSLFFSDSWSHGTIVWWLCKFAGGYYKLCTLFQFQTSNDT